MAVGYLHHPELAILQLSVGDHRRHFLHSAGKGAGKYLGQISIQPVLPDRHPVPGPCRIPAERPRLCRFPEHLPVSGFRHPVSGNHLPGFFHHPHQGPLAGHFESLDFPAAAAEFFGIPLQSSSAFRLSQLLPVPWQGLPEHFPHQCFYSQFPYEQQACLYL